MKTHLFSILMALAFSLTTTTVAQNFSTGSDLMNTGSSLSSNIYGIGATGVDPLGTTTSSGPKRRTTTLNNDDDPFGNGAEGGEADNGSPIGAPYIMLLFAAGAAGVVALRRRKTNRTV